MQNNHIERKFCKNIMNVCFKIHLPLLFERFVKYMDKRKKKGYNKHNTFFIGGSG